MSEINDDWNDMEARSDIATRLEYEVVPWERAIADAKSITTETLIHRIRTEELSPEVSSLYLKAYMAEAKRRIDAVPR